MFIILVDCSISRTFPLGGFFPRVLYVQACQTAQTGMERCVFDLPPLPAPLLVSDLTMWNLELFWKKFKNSWKIWSQRGRGIKLFEKQLCHKIYTDIYEIFLYCWNQSILSGTCLTDEFWNKTGINAFFKPVVLWPYNFQEIIIFCCIFMCFWKLVEYLIDALRVQRTLRLPFCWNSNSNNTKNQRNCNHRN